MLHAFSLPKGVDELDDRRGLGSVRDCSDNHLYCAM